MLSVALAILLKISNNRIPLKHFGITPHNLSDAVIYSGLAVFPLAIINTYGLFLIMSNSELINDLFISGNLSLSIIQGVDREFVPLAGIVYWLINGIISFVLLQAFPYELSEKCLDTKKTFVLTFVFWSGLYNGLFYTLIFRLPLNVSIAGELIDITVLGGLFLLAYKKARNSIGLIFAYVFVYEAPVKSAVYYGWGLPALLSLLLVGVIWPVMGISLYLLRRYKRKSTEEKSN